jgi:hypothetical protein
MIDFNNASFLKLKLVSIKEGHDMTDSMLVDGENIFAAFRTIRDMVVFTDKRIIAVNVQGLTGKKVDYTSLPYSKMQAFSVETAGVIDLDSELDIWFSSVGKVRFEFTAGFDIKNFNKIISKYIL